MRKLRNVIWAIWLVACGGLALAQTEYTPQQVYTSPMRLRPVSVQGSATLRMLPTRLLNGSYARMTSTSVTTAGEERLACANTVSITVTLGQSTEFLQGKEITISDVTGTASASKKIVIQAHTGGVQINSAANYQITTAFGSVTLICTGTAYVVKTPSNLVRLNGINDFSTQQIGGTYVTQVIASELIVPDDIGGAGNYVINSSSAILPSTAFYGDILGDQPDLTARFTFLKGIKEVETGEWGVQFSQTSNTTPPLFGGGNTTSTRLFSRNDSLFFRKANNTDVCISNPSSGGGGGGGGGAVSSVFGRTGAVTAQSNDYTFAQIGSKPTTRSGYGITDAEGTITAGTTAQYWRGDKSWQTLNAAAVGLGNVPNVDATNASNLSTGMIPAGRYGATTVPVSAVNATGTANNTTFLRGDGTWATPAGGGSGIANLNGQTGGTQNLSTGTTGTDFNISSSADVHRFNIPTASATNRGLLSSANWTTFNNKENAITAGTTAQYWRGDKSWQTLNAAALGASGTQNSTTFLRGDGTWSSRLSNDLNLGRKLIIEQAGQTGNSLIEIRQDDGNYGQTDALLIQRNGTSSTGGADPHYTLVDIAAPSNPTAQEATISLSRQLSGNNNFLDIFNNGYPTGTNPSTDMGLRNQIRGTTAAYTDLVMQFASSLTTVRDIIRMRPLATSAGAVTDGETRFSTFRPTIMDDLPMQFNDADNSNWVRLSVPTSVSSNYTFTLPGATGTNGQVLTTDGSGNTSWTTVSGGGGGLTSLNGQTGSTQNLSTGTTGTDFTISSTGNVHTFNLPTASSTVRGLLSAANWTTFNNKENAITAGVTGQYWRGDKTWQTLNASAVGLGNVPNVDATNATNLSTGTIQAARFGNTTIPVAAINATGTANNSTFLRGDGQWASPAQETTTYVTADYTILANDVNVFFNLAANGTITLPTAVGRTGKRYTVKKIFGVGNATLATFSTQTIDGLGSIVIARVNESVTVVSDGANWFIVARGTDELLQYQASSTGTSLTGVLWSGSPPTSIQYAHRWSRVGNMTTVEIHGYGTVAATSTGVDFTLPSTCPTPDEWYSTLNAQFPVTAAAFTNANAVAGQSRGGLIKVSGGWTVSLQWASTAVRYFSATITYRSVAGTGTP